MASKQSSPSLAATGPALLLNKNFRYVPACATDIRKTFKRVQREMERQRQTDQHELALDGEGPGCSPQR
ncbi:MAG: hypothetical protein E2576_11125 [Alcaligenaceae bacterium]|nr:hypothetical protein [Alcaligenaceae bacterium SAGV5]MPS51240.1 hypothetical protein [Alcaligenaceae bacterium SAGV3]MPT57263.1 hypothetical protein [Alcaligenaceae bacterium]